ncbi:plasmid partitioning protein RepB [Neorhizobium sp. NCHU2750]|uniref:plasmid partitioning protein RepB n=1 Tax=Neorhizobium sp. NCHU2750 TaxID=1825976 RepID=UPI000E721EC6|nr:replication protein B [Neorhizobium sp. NCHU2750]
MARKNFLAGLNDIPDTQEGSSPNYPMRGASKTMIRSLDEIAKQADKFLEGEVIVELEPELIDGSFISDRLEDNDAEFLALVDAIKTNGQNTPILVRPHPSEDGRYQVVFGHRRWRAAKSLGLKVRAVVKPMDDQTHVIAQGQENSARANLSFIERAVFAKGLEERGYGREVVSMALSANASTLSKMMSVTERIPAQLIRLIGPSPTVGRERWIELSLLVGKTSNSDKVDEVTQKAAFADLTSDERFSMLYDALNKSSRPVRKVDPPAHKQTWQPADKAVSAEITNSGKTFSLSMKAKNASRFGDYLSSRLNGLYAEFLKDIKKHGE